MNVPSVVSNRTSSLFTPFYIVILPTSLQGKEESFQASFLLVFVLSWRRLFMFSQQRVQPRARPHLLWKWRCYNEVGERDGSALLLVRLTEPFCIFSPRSSLHRLSPYLRVEFHLFLQFFILPSPCPLPFSFLLSVRTYDSFCSFEHRANYFLSGSVES